MGFCGLLSLHSGNNDTRPFPKRASECAIKPESNLEPDCLS